MAPMPRAMGDMRAALIGIADQASGRMVKVDIAMGLPKTPFV